MYAIFKKIYEKHKNLPLDALVGGADLFVGRGKFCPGTYLVSLKISKMELGTVFGVLFIPVLRAVGW